MDFIYLAAWFIYLENCHMFTEIYLIEIISIKFEKKYLTLVTIYINYI